MNKNIRLVVIILLTTQIVLTITQGSRYSPDYDSYMCLAPIYDGVILDYYTMYEAKNNPAAGDEEYACRQMSRDCEYFFEDRGITVHQVRGINTSSAGNGHAWILLDFGWIQIPYECTALCVFNPGFFYHPQYISDGYLHNGLYYDEADIKWYRYD